MNIKALSSFKTEDQGHIFFGERYHQGGKFQGPTHHLKSKLLTYPYHFFNGEPIYDCGSFRTEIPLQLFDLKQFNESIQIADTIPSCSFRERCLRGLLGLMVEIEYDEGVAKVEELINLDFL